MKNRIASFSPVAQSTAQILVLGSIPGEASLHAGQYYAHPRNAFWKMMGELVSLDPNGAYEERLEALKLANIALWDVLHSCHRKGSLDAAIEPDSIEVNDFNTFFDRHLHIKMICFNGATAERYYKKYVALKPSHASISRTLLPSTSPAHASLSFEQKVIIWRAAIGQKSKRKVQF
jgi:double-stranded uracil-DNA glycosylase